MDKRSRWMPPLMFDHIAEEAYCVSYYRSRRPPPPPPRGPPPPKSLLTIGFASLTVRARPSRSEPLNPVIALLASSSLISTKPKPFERPVSRSVIIVTDSTDPNRARLGYRFPLFEKTDFQQTFSSFIFLICKGTSRAWRQGFKINPLPVRTGASKHLKFGDLSVALLRIRRQKRLSTGQFLAQPFRNLGWIAPIEGAMAQG